MNSDSVVIFFLTNAKFARTLGAGEFSVIKTNDENEKRLVGDPYSIMKLSEVLRGR